MAIGAISVTWAWRISIRRLDGSFAEGAALSAIAITSNELTARPFGVAPHAVLPASSGTTLCLSAMEANVHAMVAGGGPFKTPTQNEGLLDERQKDYRDQTRKDEIAREVPFGG